MSYQSEVFSAVDRIEAGDWDNLLHRLKGAIILRQQTDEYKATLIAGESGVRP